MINLQRKKQICVYVNKVDCHTVDNKKERVEQDDELDGAPKTRRYVGANDTHA